MPSACEGWHGNITRSTEVFLLLIFDPDFGPVGHSIYDSYDEAVQRGIALGVSFGVLEV